MSAAFASRKDKEICRVFGCNHKIKTAASEGRTRPSKQGSDCCQGAEGQAARAILKTAMMKLNIQGNTVKENCNYGEENFHTDSNIVNNIYKRILLSDNIKTSLTIPEIP